MKKETVEEFLARGGKITKVEVIKEEIKEVPIKSTKVGPVTLLSLSEGDLFYGEKNKRKKKIKEVTLSETEKDIISNGEVSDDLKKFLGI